MLLSSPLLSLFKEMAYPAWMQLHIDTAILWISWALTYVDLRYLEVCKCDKDENGLSYLLWLFFPLLVAFLLPVFLVLFIYGVAIFLHIYRLRHRIRQAYASSYWNGARISIASFWDAVGNVWHGFEIEGFEHVPEEGPVLFLYYHGTLPIDVYYLIAKCILHKNRTLHCVGDKFLFNIPGWDMVFKVFNVTPGTVEDCVSTLKQGNLLCISPGGVREALFSDSYTYPLLWAKRLGFARIVLQSGVVRVGEEGFLKRFLASEI